MIANLWDQRPILIVEDSNEDFEATLWALRKTSVEVPVLRCKDGDEAIAYLDQCWHPNKPDHRWPAIVLLDLNLPRTDGRQVLQHIKSVEALKALPVIVLTTSTNPRDIEACYRYGANSYVEKPVSLTKLQDLMRGLAEYWFRLVLLPKTGGSHGS